MQSDEQLKIKPAFRWSFSQWTTYDECPAKWKFGSVMKFPRKPPGAAAARGLDVHDTVERYIKSEIEVKSLHPAVKPKYIPILDEFKNHQGGDRYTEKKLAFDAEWNICDHTSKFASCVAVLDAVKFTKHLNTDTGVLDIGEWKSGKPKDNHRDQRTLYAMFGMRYWYADEVKVTTYYLEDTAPPARIILSSEAGFETLRDTWASRISTMQRDQMCAPRPGYYCRWCDFSKASGGPCVF